MPVNRSTMICVTVVIVLIASAAADLGDTNPPYGSCLCADGTNIRVRNNPGLSSSTIGYMSTGHCFTYLGLRLTTDGYRWFKINFNGQDGWTAGSFLNLGTASQCSPGGGSCSNDNEKLGDSTARGRLSTAGISVSSSGSCSNRYNPTCTSLEQVRCKCINDIIWFKQTAGCTVIVTGGTETGHSSGTQSHWNGYKLDIGLSTCVDNYIKSRFAYIGIRGDGAQLWRDSRQNVYALEGNHWDILYP